jgi:hypothetical protein
MKSIGLAKFGGNSRAVREVTERRTIRVKRAASISGLVLAGFLSLMPAAGMANEFISSGGGSPAAGHAQVVAQSVIQLPDAASAWRIAEGSVSPTGDAMTAIEDGFLVDTEGVLLVTDNATGYVTRLASGEAMAIHDGVSYQRMALGNRDASFYIVGIGEDGSGPLFEGRDQQLAGVRDLDLLRDQLDRDEQVELTSDGGSIVVLATRGEVKVTSHDGKCVRLSKGSAAEFAGDIEVAGNSGQESTFVAAIVGEKLSDGVQAPPADVETEQPAEETYEIAPEDQTSGPHVEDTADPDRDGLDNTVEHQVGTDPYNEDTDGDGLDDFAEVAVWGTDPLMVDSDFDDLTDGQEVFETGTDPQDDDSDNDTLTDGPEIQYYGSDPLNPDTDGDNLMDSEAFLYGTSPTNSDTDADGLLDLDEIGRGTLPTWWDSDYDNVGDGEEIALSTDPLDINSHP